MMQSIIAKQDKRVKLIMGDLTSLAVDAVVNAAKEQLTGGSGVDGAIHRAGGRIIFEECMRITPKYGDVRCPTGEAVITSAGNMVAKYVIHTVGPIWRGGFREERTLLANAYKNSLKVAAENGVKSIAFPNISTGIYAFPKELAAEIATNEVFFFLKENPEMEEVIFCCFDEENFELYKDILF